MGNLDRHKAEINRGGGSAPLTTFCYNMPVCMTSVQQGLCLFHSEYQLFLKNSYLLYFLALGFGVYFVSVQ